MDKLPYKTSALITISCEEYHSDIKKYVELTKGNIQVQIVSNGSPIAILGRGPKLFEDLDEEERFFP